MNYIKYYFSVLKKEYMRVRVNPKQYLIELKRLERHINSNHKHDKLKLHFGCGPRILKGWINFDLSYADYRPYMKSYTNKFYPKHIRGNRNDLYIIDVTKYPLPFKDNSVDLIFHEDFIEHLNQKEQILFLAECFRVLKNGGIHRINSPSLIESMSANSDFSKGFNGVYVQEWDKHVHKNILTQLSLSEYAKMIGYRQFIRQKRDISVSQDLPLEYRPNPNSRSNSGNVFVDLIK